jgi:hypothetical protein
MYCPRAARRVLASPPPPQEHEERHGADYSRGTKRFPAALVLALALAAAGCGGGSEQAQEPTPESVVRAWSVALNSGDNEAAARLFARNARIVQGPLDVRLRTHRLAVLFNRSLPCSGRIVRVDRSGEVVTATFVLGPRPNAPLCTGPGQKATAAFTIRHGKIVVWHQIPTPGPGSSA